MNSSSQATKRWQSYPGIPDAPLPDFEPTINIHPYKMEERALKIVMTNLSFNKYHYFYIEIR